MLSPVSGLFERLGGFDALEQGVARYVARLQATPEFGRLLPVERAADAGWQLQLFLTDLLGGPMAYDGPDPRSVCAAAGIDGPAAGVLIERLLAAFAEGPADAGALDELRGTLTAFAGSLGLDLSSASPASVRPVPDGQDPRTAMIALAEGAVAAAGLAEWPLFVLDADLVLVYQNPGATAALGAADADLRRAFGLGATELMGQSVLRFHPAPTQLHGILADTPRLPREVTWCFGRTTWRARIHGLPAVPGQRPGFAMAWRDESAAHRRDTILTRLRAQAEELPVPLMYPQGDGELWQGNAACEHALRRLGRWLPSPVDPMVGVPGALFFPEPAERRALFESPELLPLKKRLRFGPETVSLLVSAIRDDEQQFLCPQVTWEIVHTITPAPDTVAEPPAAPVELPAPASPPAAHALRQEARALEASARGLLGMTQLLDALADQVAGQGSGAVVESLEAAREAGSEILRQAEQGVAVLAAARQVTADAGRSARVTHALRDLAGLARRTNELVLDASLRAVEDDLRGATEAVLLRAGGVREVLTTAVAGLTPELQQLARRVEGERLTVQRLAELRESLREAPAVDGAESVTAVASP